MNQYQILNKLGEGAFSVVYKVKRKQDGQEYAMKKMRIMNFNDKQLSNCLNEVRILASITDEHIVAYRDSFYDELTKTFCIVTDFLDGGDLAHFISRNKNLKKPINEKVIWDIAYQILKGLKSLHDAKILHRDIKSANVFMTKDHKIIKLGDMNVSIVSNNGMARTQTGTPYYASPEVWNERPYSSKCDIWSFGCVLYEMITFKPPFVSSDLRSLKRLIVSGMMKKIPNTYSAQLWQFIQLCLKTDPKERASAQQLLKNRHFVLEQSRTNQQKTEVRMIQRIFAPKKKQFRIIKDRLPRHRFSSQRSVDNFSCMSDREKDKENLNQSNLNESTKLTKPNLLPSLKRPTSASTRTFNKSSVSNHQIKAIEPNQRPPLPLPRHRALRA